MPEQHALLSASSAYRWIQCPPSARLSGKYADNSSEFAREGTAAHSLCEYKLKTAIGQKSRDPTEDLLFYNDEMEQCASEYATYVLEQIETVKECCSDPAVLVEQRVDFSKYVPEAFGTADCLIVADGELQVIDFKYGIGILVEAERNPQMMCYALGALELFDGIYDIGRIRMTIIQPRRENISTAEMSKEELLKWADEILTPAARLAFEGKGEYKAGAHCQFCKARGVCRKRAEYNLELAKYDFALPETLDKAEISYVLSRAEELSKWAGDVKAYALQKALSGTEYPGFKIVEGRSVRKYTDETAAADAVKAAGYDPYEKKMLGITAMTSRLGKKAFDEILGRYVYKPQGNPILVPESDKRPVMNAAAEDFRE